MSDSVLIVEDHKETGELVKAALEDAGFRAACVSSVKEALAYMSAGAPCLIVLDIALPDGSGLEISRWVRANASLSDIPIIVLTGKDAIADKGRGFQAGVDQYLIKPINMDELVMWAKALLRRVAMDKSGGASLKAGALEMEVRSQMARYKGEPLHDLTRREFELLYALAKNSPRIMSRIEILSQVWRTVAVPNLVDTHMFNLRRKLPRELADSLQSVSGKGFRFFGPL